MRLYPAKYSVTYYGSRMCRHPLFLIALFGSTFGCASERQSRTDAELYIQQSVAVLRTQTAKHASDWHLGEQTKWSPDPEHGSVVFAFADRTVAEADDLQIVGTYDVDNGIFFWGWDHPFVDEPFAAHAKLARQFGIDNKLPNYIEPSVHCTEAEAWEFTAVAARLADAKGAYGGSGSPGKQLMFVTFGDVKVRTP